MDFPEPEPARDQPRTRSSLLGSTDPGLGLFGSADPNLVRGEVAKFVHERLGTEVEDWRFVTERRALTYGLVLSDGSEVVLKAHPVGTIDRSRLTVVQAVQRHLSERGFAAPRPLSEPAALGQGIAVIETMLREGTPPDPARRSDRQAMARALAEIVELCLPLGPLPELDAGRQRVLPLDQTWPVPNDPGLTLESDPRETDWIDELGLAARARRRKPLGMPAVVGHGDWHVEHLRLSGGRPSAVYDWDSLTRESEAFVVGCAVAGFIADWTRDEPPIVPTFEQMREFVDDYERQRKRPFSAPERTTIDCHWVEMTAYGARIEVARAQAGRPASNTYRGRLREHGSRLLRDG